MPEKCFELLFQEVANEFKFRQKVEISSIKTCELLSRDIKEKIGAQPPPPSPQTLKRYFIDKNITNPQVNLLDILARYIDKHSFSYFQSTCYDKNERRVNTPNIIDEVEIPMYGESWRLCLQMFKFVRFGSDKEELFYRFAHRDGNNKLVLSNVSAFIPNLELVKQLLEKAKQKGWPAQEGNYNFVSPYNESECDKTG